MIDLAELENKRWRGDPLVESIVKQLVDENRSTEMNSLDLFSKLVRTTDEIPPELPERVRRYFSDTERMPDWADRSKLKIASQVFSEYGPEIVLVLFCKSLPLSYSCWRGAEVLLRTGRLTRKDQAELKRLNRRIMETAQFVINVMQPRSFGRSGKAIRTTQKIRLIHGSIRHFLGDENWPLESHGMPINQMDMAGTLMSFSWIIIEGLAELGVHLNLEQRDAYVHHWNVIGHFLGLEEELLPQSVDEAERLTSAILGSQTGPSEAGLLLSASLVDYMATYFFIWPLRCFPAYLIRRLIGDHTADLLEIPKNACHIGAVCLHLMEKIFAFVYRVENRSPVLRRIIGFLTRQMLQKMIRLYNEEKKIRFIIPPSLSGQWNISATEN
ncbi:MAG: oxygenase MpaB family protein [Pseudomonadota bacterium]